MVEIDPCFILKQGFTFPEIVLFLSLLKHYRLSAALESNKFETDREIL